MDYPTLQAMRRRTFLKGAGVALLLPRLESLGQEEVKSPRRLLTIVNHLSFYQPELVPKSDGAFGKPPALLAELSDCLLYTSPSPRDATLSRMPSSA